MSTSETNTSPKFLHSLMAGGVAGTSVDVALFPLDTLKTRLQSSKGFLKSGGFRGIYSGLGPAALGSAPTAATFFCTYESVKKLVRRLSPEVWSPAVHMIAAAAGEVAACVLRVPVEIVKQRRQAQLHSSSIQVIRSTLSTEGVRGLYRGYLTTVLREIPFSLIQFPLWEYTKSYWAEMQKSPIQPWQSSICGAFSGGVAAALTTPLDVAKTRIMLAQHGTLDAQGHIVPVLRSIYLTKGIPGLFAGVAPRVLWISIGGSIFLGVYDKVLNVMKV